MFFLLLLLSACLSVFVKEQTNGGITHMLPELRVPKLTPKHRFTSKDNPLCPERSVSSHHEDKLGEAYSPQTWQRMQTEATLSYNLV